MVVVESPPAVMIPPSGRPREVWPLISVILVVRNGAAHVSRQVAELMNLDYPQEAFEILAVDGMSTDGTAELLRAFQEQHPGKIRVLQNHRQILSTGWNIGICNAKGEIVLRVDVHATLERDYLRVCVRTLRALEDSGVPVAAVGGNVRMVAAGTGSWPRAIAAAWNSGIGTARPAYRSADKSGLSDSLALAVFRKRVLVCVGMLDERLGRTEDNELFDRLRRRGYVVYLTHDTSARYFVRTRLRELFWQMFSNGWWLLPTLTLAGRNVFRLRHFVPGVCLALAVVLLIFGGWLGIYVLLALVATYLTGVALAAFASGRNHGVSPLATASAILCMHGAYALGTWIGSLGVILRAVLSLWGSRESRATASELGSRSEERAP